MTIDRAALRKWLLASAPARALGDFVFLQDPTASEIDREQLDQLYAWAGKSSSNEDAPAKSCDPATGWLCIPTGGSSGNTKYARHDELTIAAAVSGFCLHTQLSRVNAVSVLPLHHVSGLMAQTRCWATGGTYVPWDWRNLAAGDWPTLTRSEGGWSISLVPTQLARLLEVSGGAAFLRAFHYIYIGGAAAWPELLDRAARERLPLNLSYGMTETAAMIAAQPEGAFLAGARDSGSVMPHARVRIMREDGTECVAGEAGQVQITGESLFRGYFPATRREPEFAPKDIGVLDSEGRLTILGRRDGMIITGGEKVWPAEVEAALRGTGEFSDVAVLGIADEHWGQAVTAFYPRADGDKDSAAVGRLLENTLATFKLPKRLVPVEPWPRNAQGKVNRQALVEFVRNSS